MFRTYDTWKATEPDYGDGERWRFEMEAEQDAEDDRWGWDPIDGWLGFEEYAR